MISILKIVGYLLFYTIYQDCEWDQMYCITGMTIIALVKYQKYLTCYFITSFCDVMVIFAISYYVILLQDNSDIIYNLMLILCCVNQTF